MAAPNIVSVATITGVTTAIAGVSTEGALESGKYVGVTTVVINATIANAYISNSIIAIKTYNFAKKPAIGGIPASENNIITKDKDSTG